MSIVNTSLNTTVSNIFVSSGTNGDAVTVMYFCNTNAAPTSFSLYIVPAGQTADSNTVVYTNKLITSGDTYIMDTERLLLDTGDMVQASANAAGSITATVSYIGI
jgi:hypothetical protein